MTKTEVRELKLPEFAFLSSDGENDILRERTVVLHTKTASIIEIFDESEMIVFKPNIVTLDYTFENIFGNIEKIVLALHYCAGGEFDADELADHVLLPCAQWYVEYLHWEDRQAAIEAEENRRSDLN